jgi:DNA repair exonuclease SbcCD ATPase subunit
MNTLEYNEMARDVHRELEHEREKAADRLQQVDNFLQLMEYADASASKAESLQQQVEELGEKVDELQRQLEEKELQLTEFSKLTAGVAKKSSQDEVLKALRTFINISKRKTLSKRITVKMVIMEFANSIGLSFPEEVSAVLDSLDDETETAAPVTVNVAAGGINVQQANAVNR